MITSVQFKFLLSVLFVSISLHFENKYCGIKKFFGSIETVFNLKQSDRTLQITLI